MIPNLMGSKIANKGQSMGSGIAHLNVRGSTCLFSAWGRHVYFRENIPWKQPSSGHFEKFCKMMTVGTSLSVFGSSFDAF